jgi:hypothetical protein
VRAVVARADRVRAAFINELMCRQFRLEREGAHGLIAMNDVEPRWKRCCCAVSC